MGKERRGIRRGRKGGSETIGVGSGEGGGGEGPGSPHCFGGEA